VSLRDILAGLNTLPDNDWNRRRLAGPMMAVPPIERPRMQGAAHP